jgi:hypothetical protein
MPSSTTIQQLVNDLRDRKSTIAVKFDDCYEYCSDPKNAAYKAALVTALGAWTPGTTPVPTVEPEALTTEEEAHINAWPGPDADSVRNAMLNALNDNRQIAFFWDLDDDDLTPAAKSKSKIDPPGAGVLTPGGTGAITVTFLTPRKRVTKSGITYGDIKLGI